MKFGIVREACRFPAFLFVYPVRTAQDAALIKEIRTMQNYLLLLRGNNDWRSMSPEEIQVAMGKYRAWGQKLRDSGRYVGSNKLEDDNGRVMATNGGGKPRVTDGPYAETKDVVGGYYMIEADSYEEVVEIAGECPHLQFGLIEVRRIEVLK
jgi:hypothetical protein